MPKTPSWYPFQNGVLVKGPLATTTVLVTSWYYFGPTDTKTSGKVHIARWEEPDA